jgi:tripartite-type tricarboxylate transporter receptor subunit TctC
MGILFTRWIAAILAMALCTATAVVAEDYPTRPVRMIIPFSAGGPTDVAGRIVGKHMTEILGKTIVVDNRPGASGTIAAAIVIRAAADGYTLLFGSNSTFAVNPAVFSNLPYDVFRDLELVGLAAYAPHLLAIRAGIPANTVAELIALAKKQPGKLTFASSGPGAIIHMSGELFKYHAKIDIVHVPYKGGAPATVAMLSGEVDMMMNDLSQFLVHIKSGKLKGLAIANAQRSPLLPKMPTFAEVGFPEVESGSWFGLAVPANTPKAVVGSLNNALGKVLVKPEYKQRLVGVGMEALQMTPEQAAAFTKREIEKWRKVAKAANVSLK